MKQALVAFRAQWHAMAEHSLQRAHHAAHMAYLGLVAVESHGWYGKAAAALLIIAIAAHFVGTTLGDE